MSHHSFTNLREIFQGDMSRKLTFGLTSQCFDEQMCPSDDQVVVTSDEEGSNDKEDDSSDEESMPNCLVDCNNCMESTQDLRAMLSTALKSCKKQKEQGMHWSYKCR